MLLLEKAKLRRFRGVDAVILGDHGQRAAAQRQGVRLEALMGAGNIDLAARKHDRSAGMYCIVLAANRKAAACAGDVAGRDAAVLKLSAVIDMDAVAVAVDGRFSIKNDNFVLGMDADRGAGAVRVTRV